jgi:hypothetical protein
MTTFLSYKPSKDEKLTLNRNYKIKKLKWLGYKFDLLQDPHEKPTK